MSTASPPSDGVTNAAFSAEGAEINELVDCTLDYLPAAGQVAMLDLGCGTGWYAERIAHLRPNAQVIGVDTDLASIAGARARPGVEWVCADYLEWNGGRFDLILAESVLHLIPGESDRLARKLAGDLNPGGILVYAMPFPSLRNAALATLRRIARAIRSPLTDAAVFHAARAFHKDWDIDLLRQRVGYMYTVPERMDCLAWRRMLAEVGLRFVAERPMPDRSAAKLRDRIAVFQSDLSTS